ncbi:hypothetical protein JKP88DRAFT_233814 [Tribonema minus]|uniref:Uncharacterized protein n=1 Tax=Tribonema minus TaxID=303371 RepID=A0A835ZH51_9STRA|nr:hypothetical protein JKP88DRAFT_233814 [Tribonema minus]
MAMRRAVVSLVLLALAADCGAWSLRGGQRQKQKRALAPAAGKPAAGKPAAGKPAVDPPAKDPPATEPPLVGPDGEILPVKVCGKEWLACKADDVCSLCLKKGDIPPKPSLKAADCDLLTNWWDEIDFKGEPACADYMEGESLISKLLYCRFDSWGQQVKLQCEAGTFAPSTAPSDAPSNAPSLAPSNAPVQA